VPEISIEIAQQHQLCTISSLIGYPILKWPNLLLEDRAIITTADKISSTVKGRDAA
jgi:hypothetical protein